MPRSKDTAAADEDLDIKTIIAAINTKNPTGLKIIESFKQKFSLDVLEARTRQGASRSTHYDFEINVGGAWKRVEHKGSQQYRPIGDAETPWKAGVQFHNGGCEKYSIAKKYAADWYEMYVKSNKLKEEFSLTAPTPSFEDWFNKDCKVQGDPKTPFGKELKEKVRASRGPRTSLLEKRAAILSGLDFTEAVKTTLIQEVMPIANHALEQKDYWLTIHGSVTGNFYCAWYPNFTITAIQDIIVTKNLDMEFEFRCANDFTFNGILRWGKGAGFSCLRIDLK